MTSKQTMLNEAIAVVNDLCDKVDIRRPVVEVVDTMRPLGRYRDGTILINLSKSTNGYALSPSHDQSPKATMYHEACHHFVREGVIQYPPTKTVSLYASKCPEERTCEAFMVWLLDRDYFRLIDRHYSNFLDVLFRRD